MGLTFIDWFAGVGGFRKGMENAGHKCIGFCEFDKYAVASYTSMHLITEDQREYLETLDMKKRQKEILKEEYRNGEWYAEDVRTVRADEIPRADCWCFGFPCQDISVAGKQLGFAGHRSSLFFAVTKLIRDTKEEDRPQYLFIENVKNLLSVNRGFDFAKLLVELDEIGYDAEWSVLNSKDHGVPQNRERVFVIGRLRGRSGREVFPVEGADGENRVSIIGHRDGFRRNLQTFDGNGITEALSTCQGGAESIMSECLSGNVVGFNTEDDGTSRSIKAQYHKNSTANFLRRDSFGATGAAVMVDCIDDTQGFDGIRVYQDEAPTLRSQRGGLKVALPVLTPDRAEKRQNGRRFKDDGEQMFTLTGQDKRGVAIGIKGEGDET